MSEGQGPRGTRLAGRSDADLVVALRDERDVMAFESLMQRYQRPLFGFILRQVGNRAHAEDLFQQAFLRIYAQIGRCNDPNAFKPWAFSIASNLCRNEKRRQRVREGEQPTGDPEAVNGQPGRAADPESSAMAAENRALIRGALDSLGEGPREVFILYHYSHLSYDEIADALAIPLGTVKSRMNSALTQLRGLLADLREK